MADQPSSFLLYARWGVMLEAGWELTDIVEVVLPYLRIQAFFQASVLIVHHCALYGCIPINLYMLDGVIGREICVMLVTMAGATAPLGMLLFVKQQMDWEIPWQRCVGQLVTWVVAVVMLTTRGPVWWWTAHALLLKTWNDPFFWFYAALAALFQVFNVLMYIFVIASVVKIFQVRNAVDVSMERNLHIKLLRVLTNQDAWPRHTSRPRAAWAKLRHVSSVAMAWTVPRAKRE
eukprot:TRINITY_DN19115_c0_g2_i1.p1 TRINITY_DN19115_c0_g2~~TRINITY_DN19115_c0_g2_i1.p1  ORF type:complete len:233 (+),score=42.40 TRINITY_DN19115_c0_g2_i1:197-895(+)